MSEILAVAIVLIVLPFAVWAARRQEANRRRRLGALALPLGAQAVQGGVRGQFQGRAFDIRFIYTGKNQYLSEVVVSAPFDGYPFRVRPTQARDRALASLHERFKDFETGDADFDKRFHMGVKSAHQPWMTEYVRETGRLDALEWFFASGYASVHSDGYRLHATFSAPHTLSGVSPLDKDGHPVWSAAFMRETLVALDRLAQLRVPVPYESWEERIRRIARHGLRMDGPQAVVWAVFGAIVAWLGIVTFMALRGSGSLI